VAGAHFFIDMIVDTTVRYGGEPPGLTGYEKATAFFLLLQVLLAVCATGGLLGVCIHKRMHTRMNAPCDRRVGVSRCSAREAVLAC
jgi:hypothetical protein